MIGTSIRDTSISGDSNKIVQGDDNSQTIINGVRNTKLSILFQKLKGKFERDETIEAICDNLRRYTGERDKIGLEQKLKDANMEYLYEDAAWLKQEYTKKLTKYQFFEPAQEIYAFILGIICEKFRNIIYPLVRDGASNEEVNKVLSDRIINPIVVLIQQEGCDDIMGLSSTDIEGMVFFLTGNCHIRWKL